MTYDPTLPSDRDWVRFLIGDRTSPFRISDDEIDALLIEERNKYLAAARAGEICLTRGMGITSKSVEGLSISFGDSPTSAYRSHLQRLREKGARLLLAQQSYIRIL